MQTVPRASLSGPSNPGVEIEIDGYKAVVRDGHVVVHIPSKSDPERIHRVYHTKAVTSCTCTGFAYTESCWHTKLVRTKFTWPDDE